MLCESIGIEEFREVNFCCNKKEMIEKSLPSESKSCTPFRRVVSHTFVSLFSLFRMLEGSSRSGTFICTVSDAKVAPFPSGLIVPSSPSRDLSRKLMPINTPAPVMKAISEAEGKRDVSVVGCTILVYSNSLSSLTLGEEEILGEE